MRSKLQQQEILEWYRKRYSKSVKEKYLYLPEEIQKQEEAQVIFQNLDRTGEAKKTNRIEIKKIFDITQKGKMGLNENQIKILFNQKNNISSVDMDEFKKQLIDKQINEQFTQQAQEIRKYTDGYLPIYFNSLISHLSFVANREELLDQAKNPNLNNMKRFQNLKAAMRLQPQTQPQEPVKQNVSKQKVKRKLSQLKEDYEGPKVDPELSIFVTQMKNKVNLSRINSSVVTKKEKKLANFSTSIPKVVSLPFIDKHQCWYNDLSQIDKEIHDKVFGPKIRQRKQKLLTILKKDTFNYMKKAKEQYNIQFDSINDHNTIITQSGRYNYSEELISQIHQMTNESILTKNDVSSIKRVDYSRFDSGDHVPQTILKRLQIFSKNKDSTHINDKSILSTQSKNHSRVVTPYQYRTLNQSTVTDYCQVELTSKKRTQSQSDFINVTPSFNPKLPYL
ncbi:hypothetical protein pb186bvf_006976 [Paramecium bursaria]